MEAQEILDIIDDPDFRPTASSYSKVETSFEIKPNNFLDFAKMDLASEYSHKDINALSNAKRALDCQLDSLLVAFGLYKIAQKESWNFPKKIQIINELGIVAPSVFDRINRKRNLMEHEFVRPNSEQVDDFLDIVSLFFAATDRYINYLNNYCDFQVYRDLGNSKYEFVVDGFIQLEGNKLKIKMTKFEDNEAQETENIEIESNNSDYIIILGKYLQKTKKY
jgi:hypothetical protein